ncbi:uncharacterized protein TNCV_3784881 [Trichonephila clavipes]|nr:uncharacterized protein TNCV_3784881 [Trichonephila clavipes]
MPVVTDPCSCQPDCLACGRGEVPPHDCAIHVLLESTVFQERMLHGEPTEARLEEILQSGKEYLPLAMHLTDQKSVQRKYKTSTSTLSNHVVQHSFAQSTASSGGYGDGKIYLRLEAVGTLLGHVYKFTKRFDTLVIQGKDVLSVHKSYPIMTEKLVTPDVVFNILNAELSSLATRFATNAGMALVA